MMTTPPKHRPNVADLDPFNPDATCPKCGHDGVEAKYCVYTGAFSHQTTEWIRRQCKRCGFLWDERCLTSRTADRSWAEDDEDWRDDDEASANG